MLKILIKPKFKFIGKIDKVKKYQTTSLLKFYHNDRNFFIRDGFVTDFASIPYPVNKIIKRRSEKYLYSPVIHDFLYSNNARVHYLTRKECDNIFKDAMSFEGTPVVYKYIFYWAVRIFGSKYFRV